MTKPEYTSKDTKWRHYLNSGFIAFFSGLLVTGVFNDQLPFEILGIVLLILASVLFGASISLRKKTDK